MGEMVNQVTGGSTVRAAGGTAEALTARPVARERAWPAGAVWARLGLLLVIWLALVLRVHQLAGQSLWYDEAITAQVSAQGVAELTRWTADDIQPPLYYYVASGWTRAAGRGEWALRFPSVVFGVLSIPLMWVLARRLFGRQPWGDLAGFLACLLATIAPLYVYYSQEARMYTMLTCLGALAGYCLLRAMKGGRSGRRSYAWWVAFVLSAVTVLYTHYFGLFLLLAYALYFVAILMAERLAGVPKASRLADWRPGLWAFFGIALLYIPWLPAMFNRYRVDRSYWLGALKMGEALRHVAMSVTMGSPETTREKFALPLLPWFGLAFLVALAALGWRAWRDIKAQARQPSATERVRAGTNPEARIGANQQLPTLASSLLFLLLALVVPVVAVLALASRTPKFNARYLMLASPSYFLILGGGVGALVDSLFAWVRPPDSPAKAGVLSRPARLAVAAAMFGLLVVVSLQGLTRWFGDPTYNKAQWRQLVTAVQRDIAPSEAVLLVSGHAAPAWHYYAPDIPTVNLPDIEILDVEAVLGFDDGTTLSRALAGKRGAWLVQWQADAVDPDGVVPYFLDRAGQEVPVQGQFSQLKLRHWQLRPGASYPPSPDPQHADGANYGHKVALLGWDEPSLGMITAYWQALQPLPGTDYQVSVRLEDAAGHQFEPGWDGRPASYAYPTDRWQPGKPVLGRYPLPKDLPPGQYYVTVAVYDTGDPSGLDVMDVADNPAGKRVRLGPFTID
jgi:mannosyltransferase